ncbi:MAG: ATPase domain-containing protein [Candidatus Freyrarchaeum guaymaensis]
MSGRRKTRRPNSLLEELRRRAKAFEGEAAEERLTDRTPTGIKGFDELVQGGLIKGETYIVSGVSGAGKSIFSLEYLYRGASRFGEPGLYVTFEETMQSLLRNGKNFGWDLVGLMKEKKLMIADFTMMTVGEHALSLNPESFNLDGLYVTLETAVSELGIKRVVLDPVSVLFLQYPNIGVIRRELNIISSMLRRNGCTSLFVTETGNDPNRITRFGVEEYLANGVIVLYWEAENDKRSRYIEVFKMRGTAHYAGRRRISITGDGISVIY